jgi:hypothetical protein
MSRSPHLNYTDYIIEAFNVATDLGGIGKVPVNKLFVIGMIILGFSNAGFWFFGVAFEVLFLYFLTSSARFRRYIEAKRKQELKQSRNDKLSEIAGTLKTVHSARLGRLNANIAEINKLMNWNVEQHGDFMVQSKQETLNQMPIIFLKLLRTKQLIEESLSKANTRQIEEQISKFERQLKEPNLNPALEKSIRGNLEIYQKRLGNFEAIKDNEMLVELELQRIENQVNFVREGIAFDSSPEGLSSNIDMITDTLGETQDWINSHGDFLRKLSGPAIGSDPILDMQVDVRPRREALRQ